MKVLMIGSNLKVPGGITRVVKNYIQAGIEEKVNFEYFPTYLGKSNLLNILYFTMQYLKLFVKLILLNTKIDVAHIHMSYKGSFIRKKHIIKLLNRKTIPIVLHMHGSQFKDFFNSSSASNQQDIQEVLDSTSLIIALGKEWEEYYKSISRTKVISLDNAVFPKPQINNYEKIYITMMGVLSKRKGTYDLIQVALQVQGEIDGKYKFVLAGNGEVDKVKEEIKKLGLENMFLIPGWISDEDKIEEIYRKSLIYILPSYNEGMPMSILEAMSYGLPIISTDVGAISSVVKKENGVIVKPGNINEISEGIIKMVNDKQIIEKMSEKNIEDISLKYNIYNSIEKIVNLYHSIIYNKK